MDLRRRLSVLLPLRVGYWVALSLILGFTCYSMVDLGGQSKRARMRGELSRILKENQLLDRQNQQLSLEIDALKNRWDYLEKVAREDLGLVRQGELILQIAPQQPSSIQPPAAEEPAGNRQQTPGQGVGDGRGKARENH